MALLAVCAALALAACGGSGAVPSTSPAATPSSATAASPPGSPRFVPVAISEFQGMLPFVFTQSLVNERPYRSTKTVGDVVQMRHAVWTYRNVSSDPRLSGRFDVVINVDQRQADMSATLWGTIRLTNAGGTWAGRWTGGIAAGGDVHHVYFTAKGAGGYAGLVAHDSGWFVEAGEGFTPDIKIVNAGWIETTDGSPVPPAPGRGKVPATWTPVVGIATSKETGYEATGAWVFDVRQSDARLDGRLEAAIEEIGSTRADGSIDYRASNTVVNEDGAWHTPAGPIEVRGPSPVFEHFMYSTSTGSGAYAGLTYHGFWYFPEKRDIRPGDTFIVTGWIDEAQ